MDGYEDWDGETEVKPGAAATMDVPLVRSHGQFVLETEPAGLHYHLQGPDFALNGTGDSQPHELPTGRYLLTVSRQGFADVTRYVEIRRNATTVSRVEVGGAIAGRWSWTTPGRSVNTLSTLTLSLYYRGSELADSVSASSQPAVPGADPSLSELSFKNGHVTFSLTRILQGYRIVNKFSGQLEENVIRGTVDAQGRNGQMSWREWVARRIK